MSAMHAELEACCDQTCGAGIWILRVFSKDQEYGDPYDWCATAVRVNEQTVEIRGALRAPTPSEWRAMYRMFRKVEWCNFVVFDRKKSGRDGETERHTVPIRR